MSAIANVFYEQTTNQSRTGATTYADISGAEIPSTDFVTGQKYLILVSSQFNTSSNAVNARTRVAHGGTAFANSEYCIQPNLTTTTRVPYFYFVVWTAVSGENITLQHAIDNAANTVHSDQIVMFAMRIDADLTESTDWFYNENSTSNALGTTFEDGASVTWTPGTANDIWLLLYRHQRTASGVTSQGESRADLSGGTAGNWGLHSAEGELAASDIHFSSFARAISLPASSHTFKAQGRSETANVFTHLHSAVFALNLSKFKDVSQVFTATAVGYGTTAWGDAVQTLSHTKTVNGNVLILAANVDDLGATTTWAKHRLQIDNTDQPDTQTSDAYQQLAPTNNDASDQGCFNIFTRENITANITIDHDGHSNVATTPKYSDRVLVCFSMELAGAGSTTLTPSAITAAYAVNAPTLIKGAVTKTPSPITAAFAINAPTLVKGALTLLPSSVSGVWSVVTPSLILGQRTLSPSAVVATYSVATPVVGGGGQIIAPGAVAAAFSAIAPALLRGPIVLTPSAFSAIFGVPAPTLQSGPVVLTPAFVSGAFVVATPIVDGGEQEGGGDGGRLVFVTLLSHPANIV